jgi:hypothetical protein
VVGVTTHDSRIHLQDDDGPAVGDDERIPLYSCDNDLHFASTNSKAEDKDIGE